MTSLKDQLFNSPNAPSVFEFNEEVTQVFDDMIQRSVPHYLEIQEATVEVARNLAKPHANIYDLGCSTGTTLLSLISGIADPSIKIIGVDNSESMIRCCTKKLSSDVLGKRVLLELGNLQEVSLNNASLVILNYTLQFIPPSERLPVLARIRESLLPGGALILTEKVAFKDLALHDLMTDLYHAFKRRNGYSDLEIARKRDALESVLVPLTMEENLTLLSQAGFRSSDIFLKRYNFASFLALK